MPPPRERGHNNLPAKAGKLTGIPRDALAPYPWSYSFGLCLPNETENSAAQWAHKAQEGLYYFTLRNKYIAQIMCNGRCV